MASRSPIELPSGLLRTLHRIHQQRSDLSERIGRGPRLLQAAQALVTQAEEAVLAAKDDLKQSRKIANEKQLQLQTREQHIEQLQAKLNTAASNKEFSLLKEQIAADEQANSVQSDEIFEQLEKIDLLTAALNDREKELEDQKNESGDRIKKIEANLVTTQADLDRVNEELATTEAKIPAGAKSDYSRLTGLRGEDALAPLEEQSCGGCYQTLTTQVVNQLQLAHLTHCPNCNAMLYMPEDLRVR